MHANTAVAKPVPKPATRSPPSMLFSTMAGNGPTFSAAVVRLTRFSFGPRGFGKRVLLVVVATK